MQQTTTSTGATQRIMNIRLIRGSLVAANSVIAALVLSSCSSLPTEQAPDLTATVETRWHNAPQGMGVDTRAVTGSIAGVDAATRTLTVTAANGKQTTLSCSAGVHNLDQLHVGDEVKAVATEQLVTYMAKAGAGENPYAPASVVLTPRGRQGESMVVNTVRNSAMITKLDLKGYKVTLQSADGATRTVAVRPEVDLGIHYVGEQVAVWSTPMLALSVEKQ
jgi:hypothetical protein